MKKIAAVLLTVAVLASFAACTKQKNEPETTTQNEYNSSTDAAVFTEENVTEPNEESTTKQTTEKEETKKNTTRVATTAKPTTTKKKDGFLASIPAISTAPPITSLYTTPYDNQQNITAAQTSPAQTTAPIIIDTTELEPITEAKLPEYDDSGIDDSMASASPG